MPIDLDILQSIQSVDLSKVETSFPILAGGIVSCQIQDIDISAKESKKGDTLPWATIKFALAQPWKTVPIDGAPSKDVAPGFSFTHRILLAPWTDPKTQEVKNIGIQELTLLRECIYGKAPEGTRLDPNELLGQTVMVKLKFEPAPRGKDGETFGPRTEVSGYVRKAKA